MAWDVTRIISRVRNLTGLKSTSHISDAAVLVAINDYYRLKLPKEIDSSLFDSWQGLTTADGEDGFYELDEGINILGPPAYCDNNEIHFYDDAGLFYQDYPDEAVTGRPEAVLLDGNQIIVTPRPDGIYELTFRAVVKPDELVNTGDVPLDEGWGPVIALGAAIDLLLDKGDMDEADRLRSYHATELRMCDRNGVRQTGKQRPIPRF